MITLRRVAAAQFKGLQAIDLTLPERGSFLIEGRNEAGKSTLFDAIYFALYGVPLVGDIASAIHYGAGEVEVRLGLDVSGTALDVRRRARQTAKTLRSEAELTVRLGDDEELVKGSAAVTQRLQQELGGLTSEALLNSCLVAQKQLGRLETLDRSAREQALTVLLNLGKLFDVERQLKPRPGDDLALRQARTRLTLARAVEELAQVQARRDQFVRIRQLLDLRDAIERMQALQQQIDKARAAALAHEGRLVAARETLARAAGLTAAASAWRRMAGLARATTDTAAGVVAAERALAEARAAAAALPAASRRAERFRLARDQAQHLAEHRALLRELAGSIERIGRRLAEREQSSERATRLEGELAAMRDQRRVLLGQIAQLAPIAGQLQETQMRLVRLQALTGRLGELEQQRRALEEAEMRAADRAEADARYEAAAADLAEARAALQAHEHQRAAHVERQRLAQVRDLLATWIERRRALDAAEQAKRLMDDLALAVAGVEHIAVRQEAEGAVEVPGLALSLVLDHPLTGAQIVELQVTASGTSLRASGPVDPDAASGLKAGGLPTLNAAGDAPLRAQLAGTAKALGAAGERLPKTLRDAQQRLEEIEQRQASPVPAFDEQVYQQAAGEAAAAQKQLQTAAQARDALPSAAGLAEQAGRTREQVALLERECLTSALQLALPVGDTLLLPAAIRLAEAEAQQRRSDLAGATGERKGLEGQLANLDRSGKERARELDECRADLAADDEATLRTGLERLHAEHAAAGAEVLDLYVTLRAALGGKDSGPNVSTPAGNAAAHVPIRSAAELPDGVVADLRAEAQRLADEAGGELALLESKASTLADLEAGLHEAQAAQQTARAELAAGWEEASRLDAMGSGQETSPPSPLSRGERGNADRQAGGLKPLSCGRGAGEFAERRGPAPGEGQGEVCSDGIGPDAGEGRGEVSADEAPAVAICRLEALAAELAALDEPAARAAEQEALRAAGMVAADLRGALADAGTVACQAVSMAGALGHTVADVEEHAGEPALVAARLLEACPEAAGVVAGRDDTEHQLRDLDQQIWRHTRDRDDAVATLGEDEPVESQAAQAALEELERDLDARRCAVDMVVATRRRMIDKVLPDTIHNTCLLLPDLTAGRYRYASLTQDYRLQVWDERKRDYVEKSLFSGGTQDQFSLALRLGFALAALPRELGTSPGFLFLDEPLSSFDRDRTAALVDLLTHGQIATFFQQVFLISHSQSFDPGLFTHHIVMEEGRVADSTLPSA